MARRQHRAGSRLAVAAHPDGAAAAAVYADWLAVLHESAGGHDEAAEHILPQIPDPVGFALAVHQGVPAGIGLFPVSGDWAGVFCMATLPAARRRGVATAVLRAGARWAVRHRASRLYLQVMRENEPAVALYEKLGFRPSHTYHYRQLD